MLNAEHASPGATCGCAPPPCGNEQTCVGSGLAGTATSAGALSPQQQAGHATRSANVECKSKNWVKHARPHSQSGQAPAEFAFWRVFARSRQQETQPEAHSRLWPALRTLDFCPRCLQGRSRSSCPAALSPLLCGPSGALCPLLLILCRESSLNRRCVHCMLGRSLRLVRGKTGLGSCQ